MSIYAGPYWEIGLKVSLTKGKNLLLEDFITVWVYAMGVPGHIGRPEGGDEDKDPYANFLPPPITKEQYEGGDDRAVVILMKGWGDTKVGQKYNNPLLVYSGQTYQSKLFSELMSEITKATEERVEEVLRGDIGAIVNY